MKWNSSSHDEFGRFAVPDTRLVPLLKQGMNSVTLTLDTIPDQVSGDQFLPLIDRVPADNPKRCELQAE